jgi:hypothetical protein
MSISPGEATAIRRELAVVAYPHTFTRTPITEWLEDPEGNAELQPGDSHPGPALQLRGGRDASSPTPAAAPRSTARAWIFPYDAALEVGDQVSAITTSDGVVLLAGPLVVESVTASAAFGPSLGQRAYLRAGDPR